MDLPDVINEWKGIWNVEEVGWRRRKEKMGKEIRSLDNMLMRNLFCQVKKFGLDEMTVMHGWIIGFLYNNRDRDIFQKDVETEFSIGRSTVTNILKLMEKKGYIRREAVPQDGRLKRLVLLGKGMALNQTMRELAARLDADTMKGITDEELDVFYGVIRKLKENLEEQGRDDNDKDTGSAHKTV